MKETRMDPRVGGITIGGSTPKIRQLAFAGQVEKTERFRCEKNMIDITQEIQRYREAARHLWNSCLMSRVNTSSGVVYEAFGRICEELFEVVVLDPYDIDESAEQLNITGFQSLRVVPAVSAGTPILVNRTQPTGPYWDDPMTSVKAQDIELGLIGFFDWDSYGLIDMRYLRVRILGCPSHPVLVGREALIEILNAKVMALG
jgi:hypothetical protein